MSSIKARETIQHLSTIFKIKKKAIEKNNLNFPPLSVENTHTTQPTLTFPFRIFNFKCQARFFKY